MHNVEQLTRTLSSVGIIARGPLLHKQTWELSVRETVKDCCPISTYLAFAMMRWLPLLETPTSAGPQTLAQCPLIKIFIFVNCQSQHAWMLSRGSPQRLSRGCVRNVPYVTVVVPWMEGAWPCSAHAPALKR